MAVLQLIEDRSGDTSRIEPLPNPDEKEPEVLESEGFSTVDAGSDLLIDFAEQLSHAGFKILEFSLVDRYFTEVDEDIADQLEPRLRRLVASDRRGLKDFKARFLVDLFVDHVRLRNRNTGNVIVLGQEGVVHAHAEEIEYLSRALNGGQQP
ncbi:hypothetical protein [Gordonia humi]|uniref:Uncharacterized protein n=1 Tax=Gordonia humi TaxID=686429 RepID=A0A840F082_9ACTN|nr:hypothetical protein [Gordonia humi]MBB4135903.1 hypothetical protein [Gordonia humi]